MLAREPVLRGQNFKEDSLDLADVEARVAAETSRRTMARQREQDIRLLCKHVGLADRAPLCVKSQLPPDDIEQICSP